MKNKILNETTLLHLGIYGDCYNLYCKIKNIYCDEIDIYLKDVVSRNTLQLEDLYKIDTRLHKKIKSLFDNFFMYHTNLFTDLTPRLYINSKFIKSFSLYQIKRIKPLMYEYRYSTFNQFLADFELCIVAKLYDLSQHNGLFYSYKRQRKSY